MTPVAGPNEHENVGDVDAVAVIGMSGRFPGAPDVDSFWAACVEGTTRISSWHAPDAEDARVPAGGLLADLDLFDAEAFGLTPAEADLLDPQHRVFAEDCWLALEHAAVVPDDELLVSVYGAAAPSRYRPWAPDDLNGRYQRTIANAPDFLATRAAHLLDLRGEAINVQTACSSSLVAVHLACQSLLSGRSDVALAGGVSVDPDQHLGYLYQEGMVASPDGRCRPFDRDASGAVPGNGSAVVVLQRLDDALAQGRRVHAVIRATAVNQDGRSKSSFMAPSVAGQAELITSALALAGGDVESVGYLEAHGTGTRIGDPIEVQAATEAFRAFSDRTGFCSLGSLKAAFGHLDRAAGVAGLIKAIHVVREGVVPPLVGFSEPNPDLGLESSPFRVDTRARRWQGAGLRRAGVSAFGVGGTNAHVVVEQPAPAHRAEVSAPRGPVVLMTSAHAPDALRRLNESLARWSGTAPGASAGLGPLARTLGSGRRARPFRTAVVVRDLAEVGRELRAAPVTQGEDVTEGVAFLFPGQGAETAFRADGLMARYPVFRDEIHRFADALGCRAEDILEGVAGRSAELRAFAYQPSLGAVQVALARLAHDLGVPARAYCGSSIGEYAAAHLAGVFDHEGLMRALAVRAEVMAASPEGRMLTVACSAAQVEPLLVPGMGVAGDNAVDRVLVSGPVAAVDRQLEVLERAGVRARVLPGRVGPHSSLMDDAMAELAAAIRTTPPGLDAVPVVSSVTGTWVAPEELARAEFWAQHLRRPTRFRESLETLRAAGIRRFAEASPGNALTALVTRLDDARCRAVTLGGPPDVDPEESLLTAVGDLWASGVDVDLERANGTSGLPYAVLPDYPFQRRRHWNHESADDDDRRAAPDGAGVVSRAVWRPAPRPAATAAPTYPSRVTVRGDGPLAAALRSELVAAGVTVDVLGSTGDPTVAVPAEPTDGHVMVDVAPAQRHGGAVELRDRSDVTAWLRRGLLDPAAALARSRAGHLLVVTRCAQAVLADDVPGTEPAAAAGLVRCAPHEHSGTGVTQLDLPHEESTTTTDDVRALLAELSLSGDDRDVAVRDGLRYVRRYEPVRPQGAPVLRQGGTYLLLGGTGHLGAVVCEAISREVTATLVVTGRTPSRPRPPEQQDLLDRARARGCTVVDVALDSTDRAALERLLDDLVTEHGRVDGLFHLAAATDVSAFRLLEDADDEAHTDVAAAKVLTAAHLAEVLEGRDYDVVALFSSLSTVIGALRFGSYVSANAYLDALAEATGRRTGRHWTSVVWDGWSADGNPGPDALGHEDGAELLRAALRCRLPVVAATTRPVEARRADVARDLRAVARAASRASAPEPDAVLGSVLQVIGDVTGRESVSVDQPLAALGVDSLQMMQITARLRNLSARRLPLGPLLKARSAGDLAAALEDGARHADDDRSPARPEQPPADGESDPLSEALSTVQERLWYLTQLEPESPGYNVPFGWRLPEGVTPDAVHTAVRALLERHPVLRSAYRTDDESRPCRVELDVDTVPVVELPADGPPGVLRAEVDRPFDLGEGSTRVFLRTGDRVEIVFVCHHVSIDAWSVRLIREDLARLLRGVELAPVPGTYDDFVRAEHQSRQDPERARKLAYWREVLHDVEPVVPLPDDRVERPGGEDLGPTATTTLLVPAATVARLRERLAEAGATLYTAGLAGLALGLEAWTHRSTCVLGTNVANRHTPELEQVVGALVDPVVLVLRASTDEHGPATTGTALREVGRTLIDALAHADVPYLDVVRAVGTSAQRSQPLISIMATMFDTEQGADEEFVPLDLPQPGRAKFPLAVEFLPTRDGLVLNALYASDFYQRSTVDRLLARVSRYLVALAEHGTGLPLERCGEPAAARQRFENRFGTAVPAAPGSRSAGSPS